MTCILYWNIQRAANGQNRTGCVRAIIDEFMRTYSPEFICIAENTDGGLIATALAAFYNTGNTHRGYTLYESGALPASNHTSMCLLAKHGQAHTPWAIPNGGGVARGITIPSTLINEHLVDLHFVHVDTCVSAAQRTAILTGFNTHPFLAIGDWNNGADYRAYAPGNFHYSVLNPLPVTHSITSPWPRSGLEIGLSAGGNAIITASTFVDYTHITGNRHAGYTPDGWHDYFVCNFPHLAGHLNHSHYTPALLAGSAFGKKLGVSPSDHLPVMLCF